MSRGAALLAMAMLCWVGAAPAGATPSGLNNIPTADVVGRELLVLQQFTNSGSAQQTLFQLGFKYGLAEDWEVGLDKRVHSLGSGVGVAGAGGMPAGPWVFQAKYRYSFPTTKTHFALGVANVGADPSLAGEPFPYFVWSQEFPEFRGHLGYSWQAGNPALFLGFDRAIGDGETILRADWIQTDNRQETLSSFGFIRSLNDRWLVEAWASLPTREGVRNTFTLKFDYVID